MTGNSFIAWARRRPATVGLSIFFVLWFGLQLGVLMTFGEEVARWLFYAEHHEQYPPPFQPGFLVSPLSHGMGDPTHLPVNLVVLLVVGGLAEPYIGKWRVFFFVIIVGYMGTLLANATVFIHLSWTYAGASGGIFALLSYAGLRLRSLAWQFSPVRLLNGDHIEEYAALVILLAIPVILGYEVLINWNMGHLAGLILGMIVYPFDRAIRT